MNFRTFPRFSSAARRQEPAAPHPALAAYPDAKIAARHLSKTYILKERAGLFGPREKTPVPAIKDLSMEIPRGKITGVLGVNGAGKTTTIRMLASVLSPTSGSLTMDGVDAVLNPRWVKERINMISGGERNLYWRLTARENLRYFGSLYGLDGGRLKERIDRLLKLVELETAADVPVERYSKGMKQRLQIARGLINDPEYLFLDEPTLGLDILIAKEIRSLIADLARKEGKGILLTTHYIREAEELCDYIYVLEKGEIIAEGTNGALRELFPQKNRLTIETGLARQPEALLPALAELFGSASCAEWNNGTLRISGDASSLPRVLNLLSDHQIPVRNLHVEEPGLEEILMEMIRRARQ